MFLLAVSVTILSLTCIVVIVAHTAIMINDHHRDHHRHDVIAVNDDADVDAEADRANERERLLMQDWPFEQKLYAPVSAEISI